MANTGVGAFCRSLQRLQTKLGALVVRSAINIAVHKMMTDDINVLGRAHEVIKQGNACLIITDSS
jgi:hypothetical protein